MVDITIPIEAVAFLMMVEGTLFGILIKIWSERLNHAKDERERLLTLIEQLEREKESSSKL